jgi:hypothetical protein
MNKLKSKNLINLALFKYEYIKEPGASGYPSYLGG